MHPRLILASASPQRKTLLEDLGVTFEVIPSSVDEDGHPEKSPVERAMILARLKAEDIASKNNGAIVIGCDTLVVSYAGELLEKPKDSDDARRMLEAQSGAISQVHSALCIVDAKGGVHEGMSTSSVRFKKLSPKDLDWWISTDLWRGRSGAFQIDGPGQLMISHIEGDYPGIVGLPVYILGELLKKAGFSVYS
ncbi:MAG: septum formation protein Maf [Candidatus Peribacteraceae bacterium]|nr:septum formation protein Maf [Candidatus Peribacteraceae bacterium]MBP9850073.1 septum formation protein Maf [Candidatus Peribacteraceae bacterium]